MNLTEETPRRPDTPGCQGMIRPRIVARVAPGHAIRGVIVRDCVSGIPDRSSSNAGSVRPPDGVLSDGVIAAEIYAYEGKVWCYDVPSLQGTIAFIGCAWPLMPRSPHRGRQCVRMRYPMLGEGGRLGPGACASRRGVLPWHMHQTPHSPGSLTRRPPPARPTPTGAGDHRRRTPA
jgi:hypothetical protein